MTTSLRPTSSPKPHSTSATHRDFKFFACLSRMLLESDILAKLEESRRSEKKKQFTATASTDSPRET